MELTVEGRADGILKENNKIVIDEIKTTTRELLMIDENTNPLHFAQAKCYGFIYCALNNLDNIDVQVTYFNIDTENTRILRNSYTFSELKEFFYDLTDKYRNWCNYENDHIKIRNESIKKFKFPFKEYRKGQRELAVRVYKAIETSNKCLSQAPTGTGKTISTLFPSIKAMGEDLTSKIFYLTAKSITREVAEDNIDFMRSKGLIINSVTITAKEKICKMEEVNCNPVYCPYANGFYDRINDALTKILKRDMDFKRESINKLSEEFKLCPFELSLELSLFSDVIICDYNYVFDPKVYLKRFFDKSETDYTFLIDEAHNLVDRARSMYCIEISKEDVNEVKKIMRKKDGRINKALKNIEMFFQEKSVYINGNNNKFLVDKERPKDFNVLLSNFIRSVDEYLSRHKEESDALLDLYFNCHSFITISEYYDENFVTLYKAINKSNVSIKLCCVNPSKIIQEKMKMAKASIIFSATLLPLEYFKEIFGYNNNDYIVNLRSPFNSNNRLILIGDNIETTYNKREETKAEIASYIKSCIESKPGNYIAFFPSYKYMNLVYKEMKKKYKNINISLQDTSMSEDDKENFLKLFKENSNSENLGFCVLGGHFAEGIDLTKDSLIGVIIVGVGMPQIGIERDIIKDYMNENNNGFNYAYVYPGIIKVLQAAGRCIRTEEDKGIIMLLDKRYSESKYKNLLPYDWFPNVTVKNSNDVERECKKFWNKNFS